MTCLFTGCSLTQGIGLEQTNSDSGLWLNLYRGFMSSFYLDQGNDNMHPGYHSNKEFAKFLLTQF